MKCESNDCKCDAVGCVRNTYNGESGIWQGRKYYFCLAHILKTITESAPQGSLNGISHGVKLTNVTWGVDE